MQMRYPDVSDDGYRGYYLKQDRGQCRKVVRIVLWASLPLVYVDYLFHGLTTAFFALLVLRMLVVLLSTFTLKRLASTPSADGLQRQMLLWIVPVLLTQFAGNASLPREYFGHYLIDAWLAMIYFIAIPVPLRALRAPMIAFVVASLCLLAYQQLALSAYTISVASMLLAGAYSGHAISAYLHRYRRKILSAEQEMERQSNIDPVTGVVNRREFMRISDSELQRHMRLGKSLSVLVLDLDQLKQISDTYGHHAGDIVLVEVTRRMKRATRSYDCLARYGNEEFCILLPEAGAEDADRIAARTRATVLAMPVAYSGKELRVSVSMGVATMQEGDTASSMLQRADASLAKARVANDHAYDSVAGSEV
ncbi:GGDEF domain-containing protein [Undibacterium sp. Jales W-56]|uniref:GGDEF domain-containing protein n=1 Tax=Undibacterium sp. Jales W-56 TaxID=2897325 RepID=UPI0021D0618C|nr:GGDEF domain-containing protein [Undibacterium sp. Jales W-56]MCU6432831.1 GGDEF domain-containing protein [Undibacterium sp. Jales W-56]